MFHAIVIRPFYMCDAAQLLHALVSLGFVACKQGINILRSHTHFIVLTVNLFSLLICG